MAILSRHELAERNLMQSLLWNTLEEQRLWDNVGRISMYDLGWNSPETSGDQMSTVKAKKSVGSNNH
jgi:hypothetical protein